VVIVSFRPQGIFPAYSARRERRKARQAEYLAARAEAKALKDAANV
jgi:hypothetical protein